jgi:hypothetical protein
VFGRRCRQFGSVACLFTLALYALVPVAIRAGGAANFYNM